MNSVISETLDTDLRDFDRLIKSFVVKFRELPSDALYYNSPVLVRILISESRTELRTIYLKLIDQIGEEARETLLHHLADENKIEFYILNNLIEEEQPAEN